MACSRGLLGWASCGRRHGRAISRRLQHRRPASEDSACGGAGELGMDAGRVGPCNESSDRRRDAVAGARNASGTAELGRVQIKVCSLGGEVTHLAVDARALVGELKARLHDELGLDARRLRLDIVFSGRRLRDGARLADVGVVEGSMLHCVRRKRCEHLVQVVVKPFVSAEGPLSQDEAERGDLPAEIDVWLYINEDVGDLKALVRTCNGVPDGSHTLVYAGKVLEDSRALEQYGIVPKGGPYGVQMFLGAK